MSPGFYLSQNRDRAIDAYTLNNDWQQCFALALAGTTPGEGPIAMDRIGVLALDISGSWSLTMKDPD